MQNHGTRASRPRQFVLFEKFVFSKTINYQLSIVDYQLSIVNYQLSIINCQLSINYTVSMKFRSALENSSNPINIVTTKHPAQ